MLIKYFQDTDTVLVKLSDNEIVDTRDLDENTLLEFDSDGKLVSITIEHAKERANIANFSFQQVAITQSAA
jgi:uncharacterized protein YuzE